VIRCSALSSVRVVLPIAFGSVPFLSDFVLAGGPPCCAALHCLKVFCWFGCCPSQHPCLDNVWSDVSRLLNFRVSVSSHLPVELDKGNYIRLNV
jgi:hypothetical protein